MKNKKIKSLSIVALGMFLALSAYAETYTTGRCCDKNGKGCETCCIADHSGQSQSGACPSRAMTKFVPDSKLIPFDSKGKPIKFKGNSAQENKPKENNPAQER